MSDTSGSTVLPDIGHEEGRLPAEPFVKLKLYIVSATPNSNAAQANLREAIPVAEFKGELEIIDVLKNSELALSAGILVTPTLIRVPPKKIADNKPTVMIGRLDNREILIRFLRETTDE